MCKILLLTSIRTTHTDKKHSRLPDEMKVYGQFIEVITHRAFDHLFDENNVVVMYTKILEVYCLHLPTDCFMLIGEKSS